MEKTLLSFSTISFDDDGPGKLSRIESKSLVMRFSKHAFFTKLGYTVMEDSYGTFTIAKPNKNSGLKRKPLKSACIVGNFSICIRQPNI